MPTEVTANPKFTAAAYQDITNLLLSIEEKLEQLCAPVKYQYEHTEKLHEWNNGTPISQEWRLVAVTDSAFYWEFKGT